jgi:hypothetical protein
MTRASGFRKTKPCFLFICLAFFLVKVVCDGKTTHEPEAEPAIRPFFFPL